MKPKLLLLLISLKCSFVGNTQLFDASARKNTIRRLLRYSGLGHMRKFYLLGTLVLTILLSTTYAQDFSNKGKDFWVAYGYHQQMTNVPPTGGSQDMILYFAAEQSTNVTVNIPGIGWTASYVVPANTTIASATIPKVPGQDARLLQESTSPENKGIHITADYPIIAYAHIYNASVSGATILYPTNTLGKEYYSINFTNNSNSPNSNCWFYVIATDTGTTTVEITPSANTINHTQGVAFQVTLTQGQVFNIMGQYFNPGSGVDLTGSKIQSINTGAGCKKIAVFSGSGRIAIACNTATPSSDNYMTQALPKAAWGKKYLTTPIIAYNAPNGGTLSPSTVTFYRVCVADPATVVRINGVVTTLPLINNFYYQVAATSQPLLIEGDKAITVAQYFPSQGATGCGTVNGDGDPEVIYLSPVEQSISKVIWNANARFQINTNKHFINVVIPNGGTAISSFILDGTTVPASSFTIHPQDPGYSYARINVTSQTGNPTGNVGLSHIVQSDSGFNAIAYGYGGAESYGYNAGTNISDLFQFVNIKNSHGTVNFPATCENKPFRLSMVFPYQPIQIDWVFGSLLNAMGFNDTTIYNGGVPIVADSTWIVAGRTLYRYRLPRTYSVPVIGVYPVKVIATNPTPDNCGSTQLIDFDLNVFANPIADFTYTINGCFNSPVSFFDNSNTAGRAVISRYWDFGDASNSTLFNPTHTYSALGVYDVKYTLITDVGCLADTTIHQVTLDPPFIATINGPSPVCVNSTGNVYTTESGKTNYTWSVVGGTITAGGTATSNTATVTWTSTGTQSISVNYTDENGCTASTATVYNVVVNALPVVTCPLNSSVCINATPFALTGGNPASGTYSGTGVSSGNFNPATAGAATHTITYTYTDGNGCINSCTFTITVNALPVVTCPPNSSVCINVAPFALTGGNPSGGTYSGTGVSGGNFNPATAGVGTHTITYTYTDGNGCANSCAYSITVSDLISFNPLPAITSTCGTSITLDAGPGFTSYLWNTGETTQTITAVSSMKYWVNVNNAQGCSTSDSTEVSIVNADIVQNDTTICNGQSVSLSLSVNSGCRWKNVSNQQDSYSRIVRTNAGYFLCAARTNSRLYKSNDLSLFTPYTSSLLSHNLSFGKDQNGILYYGTGHEGIFRSADNGTTWIYNVAAGFGCGNLDFDFDQNNTLYTSVGGFLRGLYVSANNGSSWQNTFPGADFTDIHCVSQAGTIFILTTNYIGYSTNAGSTWTQISNQPFSTNAIMIKHLNSKIFVFTKSGQIYKSDDNGSTWSFYSNFPVVISPSIYLNDGILDSNGNWWICINNNGFFHSDNSGMEWTNETHCIPGIYGFLFREGNNILATTSTGIYKRANYLRYYWSTGDTTESITVNPTQTTTYYVTLSDGITSCTDSVTVTVITPGIISGQNSLCINQTTTYSSNGDPGGTWSSSVPAVATVHAITGAVSAVAPGTTNINYSINTCITGKQLSVNPLPVVTCPANSTVCTGTASYALSGGSPAGGVYTGTGVSGGNFNPAAAGAGTHTITYSYTDGNGCTNSCTFTITVNPTPVVSATPSALTTCSGIPTNISLSSNVAGSIISWTAALQSGIASNFTNGSGNSIIQGISNTSNAPAVVSYTIIAVANGCTSNSIIVNVTVNPFATVSVVPVSQSICPGTAITNIFITNPNNVAGTTFSWTRTNTSVLTGIPANGTGTPIIGILNSTLPNTTQTTVFTINASANGCGNNTTSTVIVNALPTPTFSGPTPVCVNSAGNLYATESGKTNYTWSVVGGTITAGGTSTSPTATVTWTSTGTQSISVNYTDLNGCTATTPTVYNVIVNALPVVTCPSNSSVCISASPFALTGGNPTGGTYSGPGVSGGNFNTAVAGAGTHAINYSYTDGNGCSSNCTFTITVNAIPVVTCPSNSSVCISAPPFALTGVSPAGGTYSGVGVSGGNFNPATAGVGTHTITYTYTDGNGCTNSCSFTITVNALPVVSCPMNSSVCINAAPYSLTGGSPAGGIYGGPGVSGGIFNPATAGLGTHTITYTYTDGNGCTNSCSFTITVNALPVVNCPTNLSVCISTPPYALTGGNPAGGTYSGTGVSGGNFNPATAGVGSHTITYTYSDSNGCTNTCTFTITVNPLPVVTCPSNTSVCISATPFALTGGSPAGGTYSGAGVSGGNFNPATAEVGTHIITYTYTDANSCINTCTFTITVNALPVVNCPTNLSVCISTPPYALTGGNPAGGTYSGTGVSGGNFNPATAGVGTHTILYTYTDGNDCTNNCTFTITVNPNPVANFIINNSSQCLTGNNFIFVNTSSISAGTMTWSWDFGDGNTSSASNPSHSYQSSGTYLVSLTATSNYGCEDIVIKTVIVLPDVNAGVVSGTSPLCIGSTTTYSSNGASGGTWASTNTSVATVNANTGAVTAIAAGTTNITYTVNTGCNSPQSAFKTLTVSPNVSAGIINGISPLCIGGTATYTSNGDAGGIWSSSNPAIAIVNPSTGNVTAVSAGITIITYFISTGCNSPVFSSGLLAVNPNVTAGTINGNSSLCIGSITTYTTDGNVGGTWSSSNPTIATVNPTTGVVTGISPGTVNIIYTLSSGCGSPASAAKSLTVNPNATAGTVNGTPNLCINQTATYASTGNTGGAWSSSNTAVATVNVSSGIVTAVGAGTTIITYTISSGCNVPVSATQLLTVSPNVSAGTISGVSPLCIGQVETYSSNGNTGGTWSSDNTAVATVNPSTGIVTGIIPGTATITYTLNSGCGSPASSSKSLRVGYTITASAGPNGSINPVGINDVDCNSRNTYTFTPDPCYHILDVLIDGVSDPAAILSGSYTFDNVSANHTIDVSFAVNGPFNIIATSSGNGTLSPPGTTVVQCAASRVYIATADPGYHIYSFLVNGVNDPGAVSSGTYTFNDVQNDHTIDVTFVSDCTPTTVSITESGTFCGNLTLSAVPATTGTYSYEWKRGATVVGTNQTLTLTNASPDGMYSVTVADGPCTSPPASYIYIKQNSLQSYTIVGLDNVDLGEMNTVVNGSIGNTKNTGHVRIHKNGSVASPGAFVKAKNIVVDMPSNVPLRILAPAVVTLPVMQFNTASYANLHNITINSNGTVNGNYNDVTIKKNKIVTLTGSVFHNVNIEDGAQVTFTNTQLDLNELKVGTSGGGTVQTIVNFTNDCNIRMNRKVEVDENCQINPSGKMVVIYLEGDDLSVDGKKTSVTANVYNPTGEIKVAGSDANAANTCYMTGRFIAKKISSSGKNVMWDLDDCGAPPPPPVSSVSPVVKAEQKGGDEKLSVQAYPNPSENYFNLKVKTSKNEDVVIRLFDVTGKVLEELKGNPATIFRVGNNLRAGIYIVELRQGENRVFVKLVKQ